jgi:hypothetical protein
MSSYFNSEQNAAIASCAKAGHHFSPNSTCSCCGWPANSIDQGRRKYIETQEKRIAELETALRNVIRDGGTMSMCLPGKAPVVVAWDSTVAAARAVLEGKKP